MDKEKAVKLLKDKDCFWNNPEKKVLEAIKIVLNYIEELEKEVKHG